MYSTNIKQKKNYNNQSYHLRIYCLNKIKNLK